MKTIIFSLLFSLVSTSPIEILNVEDAEAGYGHQMSGVPGEEVEGSVYWKAPEGDDISLTYTAGLQGYLAQGDHLPLSPEIPATPEMVLPVMVDYTAEVAAARDAFMETFNEAKMKAEEEMVEVVERRRREAEDSVVMEDDQIAMADSSSVPAFSPINYQVQPLTHLTHLTQPLTHLTPLAHLTQPLTHLTHLNQPIYVPTRTVGQYQFPQYPVFNYPGLVWSTPGLSNVQSLVPRVIATEGSLPSQKLEGEDEPAALEF